MGNKDIIILGVSAYYHDSAAAIIVNGEIIAAAEEERFTREKHTSEFPFHAIDYCLECSGIRLNEVAKIVFYDKPFLKFERVLEQTYLNVPNGFRLFRKGIPSWMETKINLRKTIRNELRDAFGFRYSARNILFTTHHYSHAASAYYPSPFNEAAVLIVDGVGEHATASIGFGKGKELNLLKEMHFPDSLGLLYSAFTYFLGFRVNNGEYKLMGLSPYGEEKIDDIIENIKAHLVTIFDDGSIALNMDYFAFGKKDEMIYDEKWEALFGVSRRVKDQEILQVHANIALAIQRVTEEIILKMARTAKTLTNSENLVLAGGVALNCVANGKIIEEGLFKNVWIQPGAGDSGGAIGAALAGYFLGEESSERIVNEEDGMNGSFLGPKVELEEVIQKCEELGLSARKYEDEDMLDEVVELITQNKLMGWVQGGMEFGPRALGARSIISSPLIKVNQTRINRDVKFREDFRPFAPAMLRSEAERLFDYYGGASYMQVVSKVKEEFRNDLPEDFSNYTIKEKVAWPSSVLEAVTHVDYSSRLQIVEDESHPFYGLLTRLKERTGFGVLLNTSFNQGGEPIVCSAADIMNTFVNTGLEYLVVENYIISKN